MKCVIQHHWILFAWVPADWAPSICSYRSLLINFHQLNNIHSNACTFEYSKRNKWNAKNINWKKSIVFFMIALSNHSRHIILRFHFSHSSICLHSIIIIYEKNNYWYPSLCSQFYLFFYKYYSNETTRALVYAQLNSLLHFTTKTNK